MSSDLMTIATSGAKAARAALDVTAQNIANASTEGYVRRSVQLAEIAPPSVRGQLGSAALSGVRLDRVERNVDLFKMAEMRRTTSDLSRANAQLSGLEDIEASLENAQIYPGMLEFEASLEALAADPTNLSLRASALESARTLARSFNVASTSLDAAGHSAQFDAAAEVDQVNVYANELARINLRLARAQNGSTDQSALLDQRDLMLQRMSALADVAVTTGPDFTVEVRLGSGGGIPIVQGGVASALTSTAAPDGTPLFAVDGLPVTLAGGSLAGHGQALAALRDHRSQLDTIAANLVAAVNTIQTGGAALDGAPGQPFFTGSTAANIAVVLDAPHQIATAPNGSAAGSRDPSNLTALRNLLSNNGPADAMNALLFEVSSSVSGLTTTRDALDTIATSAKIAVQSQAGVDLDHEAVSLIRFQQAFQASGRAMQVASDIFDTILGIR